MVGCQSLMAKTFVFHFSEARVAIHIFPAIIRMTGQSLLMGSLTDEQKGHEMAQEDIFHIRSGGRRIELYAELGRYFTPAGSLDEPRFRSFMRESLEQRSSGANGDGPDEAGEWLSSYLEQVLGYLEDKGMGAVTFRLFEISVEESARMGIEKVSVNPALMRRILSLASSGEKPEPAKKRDPDRKREKIFDSALMVFSKSGFHEATMDEIATSSGVAKGTLYRYFKSKEDLLDSLLKEKSDEIVSRLSGIFLDGEDVLSQIQDFVEQWVEFIEGNHVLYRLIQNEGMMHRSGPRIMFYEHLISNLPMIKERIVAMNEGGMLKTMSFHTVAYGMLGFVDGVVHKWFRSGMDYPLSDEVPVILEVLFNGFVGQENGGKVFFTPPEGPTPGK